MAGLFRAATASPPNNQKGNGGVQLFVEKAFFASLRMT
jgi:hypothetical protein